MTCPTTLRSAAMLTSQGTRTVFPLAKTTSSASMGWPESQRSELLREFSKSSTTQAWRPASASHAARADWRARYAVAEASEGRDNVHQLVRHHDDLADLLAGQQLTDPLVSQRLLLERILFDPG